MYDSFKVNQQMLYVIAKNKINLLQTSVVSLGRLYAKKILKKQHNMYSQIQKTKKHTTYIHKNKRQYHNYRHKKARCTKRSVRKKRKKHSILSGYTGPCLFKLWYRNLPIIYGKMKKKQKKTRKLGPTCYFYTKNHVKKKEGVD